MTAGFRVLPVQAADAVDAEVHRLQTTWEAIKFGVPEGDEQTKQMNALGEDADAVATKFPDRPEVLIWDGIITSERASMASAFSALGLAKRARDILEQAYKMAPAKLDAGAPTSLGVLYYRVPGFRSALAIRKKLVNCWSRPLNLRRLDWTLGISMVTSSMSRRNTPNPL
jgi:hypothetical protein